MLQRFVISLLAVLTFPLAAWSVASPTPQKVKLALNWKAEPQFGGFYAAAVTGEYKKRNLDVEIQEGGSGTPTVQMLSAGQTDFGIVSAEEILIARERGADIVALFAVYQTNPQAIMTHEEAGFKTLKDLFNSSGVLAWQGGLSYAMFLSKKYPDAKVQKVPYTGGISGFLKKPQYSQQCFFTSEPLLAEKAGEKVKTFLISSEGFNPYTTVLAVPGAFLKKNPEIAKPMVEAVRAGWKTYLSSPEATNKFMGGLNKSMDAKTFQKSAELQKDLIETPITKVKGLGYMQAERWSELATQLTDLKLLKAKDSKKPAANSAVFLNL